jgi:pyruvate, orthophosphate dikinase
VANVATRAKARAAAGVTLDADEADAVATFDAAMARLEVLQQGDFEGIFKAMDGLPVVVRLIDPPLHEFLPNLEDQLVKVTRAEMQGGASDEDKALLATIKSMHEQNPMLGLRGCRLGLMIPDFVKIQTRAILNAAVAVKKAGKDPRPEIMIPLVGHVNELIETRKLLDAEANAVVAAAGEEIDFKFGTMIEIPRAVWVADKIAEHAEFFSFGTNDLTQMTFGYSRDDAEGGFLLKYVEDGVLPVNPFQTLDDAVAGLMKMAVDKGRSTKPGLELGICGEHGGDPESIWKCEAIGLDYVSCSPFRVPVARLAAAQATLASGDRDK